MTTDDDDDDAAVPSEIVFSEQSATYTWDSRDLTVEDLPDIHGRLLSVGATGQEQVNLVNSVMKVIVPRSHGELPARHRDLWVPLDQHLQKLRVWRVIALLATILAFVFGMLL